MKSALILEIDRNTNPGSDYSAGLATAPLVLVIVFLDLVAFWGFT
jgi:hypothetical protein